MKKIPEDIAQIFFARMKTANISVSEQRQYMKWLRYYLDFCAKYKHSAIDPGSLNAFMMKLNEKHQTLRQQRQAAKSVAVYRDIMKTENNDEHNAEKKLMWDSSNNEWDAVFDQLREAIRIRNYSNKTYSTYANWIGRFELFLNGKSPDNVIMNDVKDFLNFLAVKKNVAASTQNQACNALLFLFRHIFKRAEEFDAKDGIVRAKQKKYIPVVLSRDEVDRVIQKLRDPYDLIVKLLYGCGMRLFEGLNLRIQCLNFEDRILTVHDGKGQKDRTVPLPEVLVPELTIHLERLEVLHQTDLESGYDGVFLPGALDRKWRNASKEFPWQWLFPAKTLTFVPETGSKKRYHLHDTHVQKAIRSAVKRARLTKRATAHTFRHSFASHLLKANYDIHTIQKLLGHSDVRTTMIYLQTVESRTIKEPKSPLDF